MAEYRSTSLARNRKPGCLKSSHSIAKTSLEIKYTNLKIPLYEEWLLLNSLTDNSKEISNETPSLKQVVETPFQSCFMLDITAILFSNLILFALILDQPPFPNFSKGKIAARDMLAFCRTIILHSLQEHAWGHSKRQNPSKSSTNLWKPGNSLVYALFHILKQTTQKQPT